MKHYYFLIVILGILCNGQVKKNTLYFTTKGDLLPTNASLSDTQTHFSLDDDIYAFMVTENRIQDVLGYDQGYFWIKVEGLPEVYKERFITLSKYVNPMSNYYMFPILLHEREEMYKDRDAFSVMQHMSQLPSGDHAVTVHLKEGGEVKLASTFALSVNKTQDAVAAAPEINPNAREKGYLQFGMKQSDYEYAILEMLQKKYPAYGFHRVIITSDNFSFVRLSSGKVRARTLEVDVLTGSGGTCRAYDIKVKQPKIGRDYGEFEEIGVSGFYPIDCQDLN